MTAENFSDEDLRFQACLAFTLKYEGGRSNDPRDPGGRTMEGVTQATYDAWRAKKARGGRDVFTIGAAERDEIYRHQYWDLINGDVLRAGEDLCVFDFAVNSGVARARATSAVWCKAAINDAISGICAHRLSFLHGLRTWRYFEAGWGRRVAACEALAIRMAYGKAAPEVLTRKADEAKFRSGKKATQATVGGTIVGSTAIAHAIHGGMSGATELGILVAVAIVVGIALFHAGRQSQRADALTSAIKDMEARASAFNQAAAAEIAQKKAMQQQIEESQQQIKLAEAREASIQSSIMRSNRPTMNVEAKK